MSAFFLCEKNDMNSNSLVVIGNGMASNRVLEELGKDHPFDAIHVLSDEHLSHYNRIMLSPLLADETTLDAITPHDADWYQQRRITVHLNTPVARIDTRQKIVVAGNNEPFSYHALLIATGSRSAIPAMPGTDNGTLPDNVLGFRTMSDVDAMLAALPTLKHATVIGAGLLGVEAAVGLKAQGVDVTLMHRNPILMNRQLDATASGILQRELEQRGIDVRTGVSPQGLNLTGNSATAVQYRLRGEPAEAAVKTLNTDLVVFATGILPNRELASAAGIETQRGICVNERMEASAEDVYSLGECCEFEGLTYGLVAPIWEQAKVVAAGLLSINDPSRKSQLSGYAEQEHLTKLKVSGVDIHSMGQFEPSDNDQIIQLQDLKSGIYKKLVIREQQVVGVLCVGDVLDSSWYFDLLSHNADISAIRTNLIFGKGYCEDDTSKAGTQEDNAA